jgi:hypothetical protein
LGQLYSLRLALAKLGLSTPAIGHRDAAPGMHP